MSKLTPQERLHIKMVKEMAKRGRRKNRLLENGVVVSHPSRRTIHVKNGSQIVFIPPKSMRAYRKYRLNGGGNVFVETLSEMS